MIVDCHAHLVPPDLLAAIRKDAAKFPNVRQIEDGGSAGARLRRRQADTAGVEAAVGYPGAARLDRQKRHRQAGGRRLGRYVRLRIARRGSAKPGRGSPTTRCCAAAKAEPHFVPLATVPLGDGARAAAVLKDAMKAGFAGAMIGTLPRGVGSTLDAADLDPFWQAADETGALIHIHPSFDAGDVRVNDFGLANGLGRITDAAVAVARLISAGHVAKYKNAKFFAPMGAAALPFVLGRLKRNAAITPGVGDPVAALAAIYTDTILHDARVLKFVIEMIGTERLMMGSDMPFPIGDLEPMQDRRGGRSVRGPGRVDQWRSGEAAVQPSMTTNK